MPAEKGFTLIELLVVMVILGVLVAVALPNYSNNAVNTKVQAVENNLRAIAAGEQKYNEDYGNYYISGGPNFSGINSALSLSMEAVSDGFSYTCATAGSTSLITCPASNPQCTFTCSASNPLVPAATLANQINIDANGSLTCFNNGNSVNCP